MAWIYLMDDLLEIKNKIVDVGTRLDRKNLTYGTSGNISVRVGDKILVTASGVALSDLKVEDIVLTDFEGNAIETAAKPSSETKLHIAIYKKRSDINAIVHCHAPAVSAYAVARTDLDKACLAENVLYFGKIPVAPYAMPSSKLLVENTSALFDNYDVVLMANHGIIAADSTLTHAFYKVDTAEAYAKVCLYSKILGKEVLLNKKDIQDLDDLKLSMKS